MFIARPPLQGMMTTFCGSSRSGAGTPAFVGALDTLIAQGAVLRHADSVRRLLSSYSGAANKLRNGVGTLADTPYLSNGALDLDAVAAHDVAGGSAGLFWHTAYDQAGIVDAVQTTDVNQMEFSTSVEAKGAMGGASALSTWLDLNLGTITQPTFFSIVANVGGTTSSRVLLGTSATNSSRYMRLGTAAPQQNWGLLLAGNNIATGKRLFGFLSNAVDSKIYVDGTLDVTGDAGNTLLDLSGGRIGSALSGTTNWTVTEGNTISEVIIFDGDPTGLAGWADFVSAQKAYFGIA